MKIKTVTETILRLESMVKKPIVTNHAFSTFVDFNRINSFAYINSIVNTAFIMSNL